MNSSLVEDSDYEYPYREDGYTEEQLVYKATFKYYAEVKDFYPIPSTLLLYTYRY